MKVAFAANVKQLSQVARVTYLDGWRGLSIALVMIGHFTALPTIQWGTLGVGMFFALSGRLMGEILWERQMPAGPPLLARVPDPDRFRAGDAVGRRGQSCDGA